MEISCRTLLQVTTQTLVFEVFFYSETESRANMSFSVMNCVGRVCMNTSVYKTKTKTLSSFSNIEHIAFLLNLENK